MGPWPLQIQPHLGLDCQMTVGTLLLLLILVRGGLMVSSSGLHAIVGPGLVEECATLGGCQTGMAKITNAYDLSARKVIHTFGDIHKGHTEDYIAQKTLPVTLKYMDPTYMIQAIPSRSGSSLSGFLTWWTP